MELVDKPIILDWMGEEEKRLRSEMPSLINTLPDISFLDRESFQFLGFFSDRAYSVVCKIKDSSGEYVAKTSSQKDVIVAEAEALKRWKHVGGNVLEVKDLIIRDSLALEVLEFIPGGTTESHLNDEELDIENVYHSLGKELAKLHTVRALGFGPIIVEPDFKGKFDNLEQALNKELPLPTLDYLINSKVAEDGDREVLEYALGLLVKDLSGEMAVLGHSDPGLHNTFGTAEIKFFDPQPVALHPMTDLATAVLWASLIKRQPENAVVAVKDGYKTQSLFNEDILNAALFHKILSCYEWWLHRGKSEPKVLDRIKATQPLLNQARSRLLQIKKM